MPKLKNDSLIRALLKKPTEFTPIWLMRQAGRYLPEYQKLRAEAKSFLNLCKNPQLATEVTLQPLKRFDLDAAILFSDILTIPDAMGLGLYFKEGEGPYFKKKLQSEVAINKLEIVDLEKLSYVMDAIALIKKELNNSVPLIGFSGSPFTLACYMIEGRGSKDFFNTKKMMYSRPNLFHTILEKMTHSIILYLNEQIKSGAQVIQIFDTWGGLLSSHDYQQYSLAYLKIILKQLIKENEGQKIPVILFSKGAGLNIKEIAKIKPDGIGIDWTMPIRIAKKKIGKNIALQGNLDPLVLLGSQKTIENEVNFILEEYGNENGHIFNLGHGINQFTPIDNVAFLVDTVHKTSIKFHNSSKNKKKV